MGKPYISDDEIAALIRSGNTLSQILHKMTPSGSPGTGQTRRIKSIARKIGVEIYRSEVSRRTAEEIAAEGMMTKYIVHSGRQHIDVQDGTILVGSDAHYWPGIVSTAHRAFIRFCVEFRPVAVIHNGDGFDGSTISRFPRIGWDSRPTVLQELKVVEERLTEIEQAARTKKLFWPLGNHDARYETYLASRAPEYEGVKGFHLKDHFPMWKPCWAVWINEDAVVKHRFKSGMYAPQNNTLWGGRTMVTGHLHSQKVMPISDYNGTRWGVDAGMLASPYGPQFTDYTEDNPVNWRSGFCLLTYWKGRLLQPELVRVIDEEKGLIDFRGQVLEV